jgi:parallel beta-helix repeat protein
MMMEKRATLILLLILSLILVSLPQIGVVKAESRIYIRADGSVEGTDKIQRDGNVYAFTGNIDGSIVVEKDDVVIDGAGYTLQGSGNGTGIEATNRSHVVITNNEIKEFDTGILLYESSFSTILGNKINLASKQEGILVRSTTNSRIINNNIENCVSGIYLDRSSRNITIRENDITGNVYGVTLYEGYSNILFGNSIANNSVGIYVVVSEHNRIYHNNFVNNTDQFKFHWFWMPPFAGARDNLWGYSYPYGGNYWSDYEERYPNATELDVPGIWNTPYLLAESNQDNYPLMAPITVFDAGMWEWTSYTVDVISNSTVSSFSFNPDEGALMRFRVDGEDGTTGFCRVTIPKDLLHTEGNWIVLVNGNSVTPSINEDSSNTYLYLTYPNSIKTIEIKGTTVIPEFPSWTPFLFMVVAVMVVTVTYRRNLRTQLKEEKR